MGLTHVTVALKGLGAANGTYEADFLVDTGATDSLAPAAALRKIGIRPVGTTAYELADGTVHEYRFGLVQIEFMGEVTAGRVIFGPDDAEPLLGVTALESVGITIDPANRTLKRLPAIPLK
ncbi:MAG TPA: clan AA aspartic protease [Candidatus Acidoferrales bacterium]|nr:clan AA aspartic protease [Candidatus Acidoferrales bacterium]